MRHLLSILLIMTSFCAFAQKEEDVVSRLKTDIQYLASDQLQGRLTGSEGETKSSLYIADEFKKYNLTPYGDSGTYLQNFKIIRLRISQNKEPLIWMDKTMLIGAIRTDEGMFYPLSVSCNKDSLADVPVFQAGYGIQAADLNHDDYKDTNGIRGKVFVIRLGHPEGGKAHSKFEPYEGINYKTDLAIKYGARGIVFIRTDTMVSIPKGLLDREVRPRSIPVIYVNKQQNSMLIATKISFSVKILQVESTAHNVIGFINNKKKRTIIIGAHQDHLGHNEFGGSLDPKSGGIHNGADDNASGVAMMLELMRNIKKSKKLRKNNYIFIAFSGEEQGLIGSKHFVTHSPVDLKTVKYMLNFDMVGRLDSAKKTLVIYGTGTTPSWEGILTSLKTDSNQVKIKNIKDGSGPSDHTSFYNNSIPALHFFSGQHRDYHKPSDDEEKINYHGMYLCYEVVMQLVGKANKVKQDFVWTKTQDEEQVRVAFKVTLGVMLDYAFEGPGVKIDGVTDDRPGQKAGVMKDDIIIKMGEFTISDMNDYMKALGYYNKGETVTITVRRGKEEKQLTVTF